MYKGNRILGIIAARGGSKGLPNKNIMPFLGRPLISYAIEQSLSAKFIDKTVVSTNDKDIALISKAYGAEVPYLRPQALANDESSVIDSILHMCNYLEKTQDLYDIIVLLQPTCPLRTILDINNAIIKLFSDDAKAIVSVSESEHNPMWMNTLPEDGCMKNFLKDEIINLSRQKLPTFYTLNGAIYVSYADYLKQNKNFFGSETYAYIMPKERSVDIDTLKDLILAEIIRKGIHNYE